jgi:ribosomal protein S17E
MRRKLIIAIYKMSKTDFNTTEDVLNLAIETNEQLVDRLITIINTKQLSNK